MKISKNKINCSKAGSDKEQSIGSSTDLAKTHIKAAIDALSESAKTGDVLARESIANLGVVLLDLSQ